MQAMCWAGPRHSQSYVLVSSNMTLATVGGHRCQLRQPGIGCVTDLGDMISGHLVAKWAFHPPWADEMTTSRRDDHGRQGAGSSVTPATTAPPSSTTAETTGVASCDPASLTFTLGFVQGAAGSYVFPLTVTNRGAQPCLIGGFFGVSIYDQQGDVIPPNSTKVAQVSIPALAAERDCGGVRVEATAA